LSELPGTYDLKENARDMRKRGKRNTNTLQVKSRLGGQYNFKADICKRIEGVTGSREEEEEFGVQGGRPRLGFWRLRS
jgi:hypothetical protein